MIDSARCSACGSTDSLELPICFSPSNRGEQYWRQCRRCRAFFSTQPYDLSAEIKHTEQMAWGDSQMGIQLNAYKQRLYQKSLKLIASHLPAPARLLDVGCAYGGFMQAAQQCGYQVCGYDIVPTAVAYVRSLGLEVYQCSSAAAFSERVKQPFDGAVCLDVNCYWHDQRSELAHLKSMLHQGGYLLMRVVDKLFALGIKLAILNKPLGRRLMRAATNDHRHSMPVRSHLRLLEELGYRVLYVSSRDALHSDQAKFSVKLAFELGHLAQRLFGAYLAPGALILAQAL
jgi:2-polyprenyl-3-methyl-5-hydroxy-6-metoxy-1,4-benzoquinol methylase